MLLTEVSKDDLLNMVEAKEKPKEEVKKIEEVPPPTELEEQEKEEVDDMAIDAYEEEDDE